jgi:hypothetical protein
MRKLVLLAPALLVACATAPAPQPIPIHGVTPGHTCDDAGTDIFIGQQATEEVGAAIKQATHAAILRWAAPGMMLTMDFRADRVTVWYTPDRKITKVHCG